MGLRDALSLLVAVTLNPGSDDFVSANGELLVSSRLDSRVIRDSCELLKLLGREIFLQGLKLFNSGVCTSLFNSSSGSHSSNEPESVKDELIRFRLGRGAGERSTGPL